MKAGERKNIKFIYNNVAYDAHFEFERQKTARTRLFWNSNFRDILKQELHEYYDSFNKKQNLNNISLPKIRVEKGDQYNFKVEFIILDDIREDLDSEDEENDL